MIRSRKTEAEGDKERYRLYIAQLQDSSALGVLEAFMEEAPQVNMYLVFINCLRYEFDHVKAQVPPSEVWGSPASWQIYTPHPPAPS